MQTLLSFEYSEFIKKQVAANPSFLDEIKQDSCQPITLEWIIDRFAKLCEQQYLQPDDLSTTQIANILRKLRTQIFSVLMERDLSRLATLNEVMLSMSVFAEWSVQTILKIAKKEMMMLYGQPLTAEGEPLDLVVIAMGKLGAHELNVSSDIDLIFVYEKEGESSGGSRRGLSAHEFFTRLGQQLIKLLDEVTADGFVFRVDMRLRPNGEAGHLVSSLDMLEEYFYVQGRDWERYAWVKARVISALDTPCAMRVSNQLQKIIHAFVYRRYLDFSMIDAVRQLHVKIQQETQKKASFDLERANNIKLGRGGIREIEFFVQVFQLIRGGQDPGFRDPSTLKNLLYLKNQELIDAQTYQALYSAYVFLRDVEHRLQYREDAQTHCLPSDSKALLSLAQQMGFANKDAFLAQLDQHRQQVIVHFDAMFADKKNDDQEEVFNVWWNLPMAKAQMLAYLQEWGYQDIELISSKLIACAASPGFQNLSNKNQTYFEHILINCLQSIPKQVPQKQVDNTILRLLELLNVLSTRTAYLAFLLEYSQAVQRVIHVLSQTQLGTSYLIRYPQLLDELLEPDLQDETIDWAFFKKNLRWQLNKIQDPEWQMDRLRHLYHAQLFHILLKDLTGNVPIEVISDELSALVDCILEITLEIVWSQLPQRHLEYPRFAIIAYGKLGAKELGYGGDIDLVFLYDDEDERAEAIYTYLARRLITWLTSLTPSGYLFDLDLRLRPDGEQGLLVTSMGRFREYHLASESQNQAWLWEQQALTKARFIVGDRQIEENFLKIRLQVLSQHREQSRLAQEIIEMRARLKAHDKVVDRAWFDCKYGIGGMVDVEFIVQYWILRYAADYPNMMNNTGNLHLLKEAAKHQWADQQLIEQVCEAYRFYRQLQHQLRLDNINSSSVPAELAATHRQAVCNLWKKVFE